jgi:hypothetical protein
MPEHGVRETKGFTHPAFRQAGFARIELSVQPEGPLR